MTMRISGLTRRFAGPPPHRALDGLDLAVEPGEFLCIVGPSGSGKTTLLRIIAGLDRDFEGRLDLPAERHLAIVFQEPRLMPWLSVIDNLLLVAPPGDDGAPQRARALLAELDVAGFAEAFPGQLSGGMQRRVALARALLTQPQLMLLDEPFVSVDRPTADHLRAVVARLWRERMMTALFVTHDLREALALGSRLVFLSRGPGRVILDWPLHLPAPGEREPAQIDDALQRLLAQHPQILAGEVGA